MVEFSFNMRGYAYVRGLEDMWRAYDATMNVLHLHEENAHDDLATTRRMIEQGSKYPYALDEDGEHLYLHEALHEIVIEQKATARRVALNAYVVMLHHYWEKSVDDWRLAKRGNNYKATREYDWLEGRGLTPDRIALEFLRKASNTIKHNNPELYASAPELFVKDLKTAYRPDYADALRLIEDHFKAFYDAVLSSGLTIDSMVDLPAPASHHP